MFGRLTIAFILVAPWAHGAEGHSRAEIVHRTRFAETQGMDFGTILVLGRAGGPVSLSTRDGVTHGSPGETRTGLGGTPPRAGHFLVTERPRRRYAITLPHRSFNLTRVGAPPMRVQLDAIEFDNVRGGQYPIPPRATADDGRWQMGVTRHDGTDQFRLGGTLTVGRNQPPGIYRGTYVVQVRFE